MVIQVYNDGKEVFQGPLSKFLEDNEHDEWLTEECKKLESTGAIDFKVFSGDWRIEKQ